MGPRAGYNCLVFPILWITSTNHHYHSRDLYSALSPKGLHTSDPPNPRPCKMPKSIPTSQRHALNLHTAVDFVRAQGVGIGIVQHATPSTGIVERKLGITRDHFTRENVKTPRRAHMLTILHALGLARGTVKRHGIQVQKVTVFCNEATVCRQITWYISHGVKALEEDVASANDRAMIKRVVVAVRELTKRGIEISVVLAEAENENKEAAKTKRLARQKGRKACQSRRRVRKEV
jgi:hypothetical protein